jgi:RNase P/RNase MRP subunit p30
VSPETFRTEKHMLDKEKAIKARSKRQNRKTCRLYLNIQNAGKVQNCRDKLRHPDVLNS